ncbi:MAG: hypothetical protein KDA20_05315 [Phycisphaerales bacterium]|nr:hypothetical protein [Phycisphaerales bacterium]
MDHREQVTRLLEAQIGRETEVQDICKTADEVAGKWVDPVSGGTEEINGLVYGLVQSGKTGVLSMTGAIGADCGYRAIIVLTSDINPLYEQTLGRIKEAYPGMDVMGKNDLKDAQTFVKRLRGSTCAIVITKNKSMLTKLAENLQAGGMRGLSCLIIDDEADQASLNTKAKKADGTRSQINDAIAKLRTFFEKNTYLQVTATPQALFLQVPGHEFRPKFTVLSHPGSDYVGGEDFFGENSQLVREFDINDITTLSAGAQPTPNQSIPASLLNALDTFMIGATFKRMADVQQNCAFLCHVSLRKDDHRHIESLLWKYKLDVAEQIKSGRDAIRQRFERAYNDLVATHPPLRDTPLDAILEQIAFFSPGIAVKLVNGETDEDVAVRSPYNLFVGGNKLGRGVTIKNLLVSYYGRSPRTPQADTVLQHARMYGYRRDDIGLLRLYLPRVLHNVFRAIYKMETSLRDLIARAPSEEFRGVYIQGNLKATRANVLAPGAIGTYTGGSIYNPAQVVRDRSAETSTSDIDEMLQGIDNKTFVELPLEQITALIRKTCPDQTQSEFVWDPNAVGESILQYGKLFKQPTGYVYIDRDRGIRENRRETQGILDGGEAGRVPSGKLTLFMLRTTPRGDEHAAWWPQVRFPAGAYAFAFAV